MNNKILLFLSTISLCFSCSSERLFFSGKVASDEEALAFFSKVNPNTAYLPDGWYEFEEQSFRNDKLISTTTLVFNLETKMTEYGYPKYDFINLNGKSVDYIGNEVRYYSDESTIVVEHIDFYKGEKIVEGSKVLRFKLENTIFNSFLYKNLQLTYYIKDYSFHAVVNGRDQHIGIEYSDDYSSIKNGKYTYNYATLDGEIYHSDIVTITSCEKQEFKVNDNYDNELIKIGDYYRINL